MKQFFAIIAVCLVCATAAQATGIQWTFTLEATPLASFKVWDHVGATFTLLTTVACPVPPATTATWNPVTGLLPGPHAISVSAVNTAGIEGARSVELTFPIPLAPTGLIKIP